MSYLRLCIPAVLCLFSVAWAWPVAAQELSQAGRQRGSELDVGPGLGGGPVREGGIPRADVLSDGSEQQPGGNQLGTDEGSPQLRRAPAERRGPSPKWLPPQLQPPEQHRWRLGVQAYNTDSGVVVTQVLRNTAAQRFGLEPGDRIVAIGGYQVGWVQDQLYPLGAELQRHADQRGRVNLLVQNVRNRQLLNLPVQLDAYGNRPRNPVRSREGGFDTLPGRRVVPFGAEVEPEDAQ